MVQTLEIVPRGALTPAVVPSRETLIKKGVDLLRRSPVSILTGPGARGALVRRSEDCCPCPDQGAFPPGRQPSLPGPMGQPQGPLPLGQPPRPQKPFQAVPQTQDSLCDEILKGLGLSRKMLQDCLKTGRRPPTKRRKAAPKRKRKTIAQLRRGKGDLTDAQARRLVTANRNRRREMFEDREPPRRKRRKKARARPAASPRRQVVGRRLTGGRYMWTDLPGRAGSCFDQKTRRFVKWSNCNQ